MKNHVNIKIPILLGSTTWLALCLLRPTTDDLVSFKKDEVLLESIPSQLQSSKPPPQIIPLDPVFDPISFTTVHNLPWTFLLTLFQLAVVGFLYGKHRCQMKRNWYEDSETTKFVTLHKLNQQLRTEIVRIDSVNQNLTNLVRMYENKCLALTLKLGRGKGNVGHRVRSKLLQSDAIQRTIAYMEQVNRIVMSKSAPNQGVSIPTMTMSSVRSGRIVRSATVIRKMCAQLLRPFQQQIENRDVLLKNILLRDYVARLRRIKNKQTNSKMMRRRSKCLVMAPAASASKEDVGKRNTKATNGHNNLTKTYPIDSEIVRQGRSVRHEMIMRKNISTVVNAPIVVTCQTMSRCSI